MTAAYVALGSNLGDSRRYLGEAIEAMARLPSTRVTARSRLYRTPPWGMLEQPPFLNAAVRLDTGEDLVAVVRALDAADLRVADLQLHQPSLDDVFHQLTGAAKA